MASKEMTHEVVRVVKATGERETIRVRQTAKLLITARGGRYNRLTGALHATPWQAVNLDLSTLRRLTPEEMSRA